MTNFDVLASVSFGAHHTEGSESESVSSKRPLEVQAASTAQNFPAAASALHLTSVSPGADLREQGGTTSGSSPSVELDLPAVARVHGSDEQKNRTEHRLADAADAVPVKLETRGITSHQTEAIQRELWARQTIHKNTVAAKLREVGETGLADVLERCHTESTWATCTGCGKSKRFLNRCENFFCPECQPTLSRDRERSIGWWARQMQQPKHVVLTLQNFPSLTKDVVKHAKKCFDRLRRRKFARNWVGGFYNWEVTKEVAGTVKDGHICSGGWHLHVHALVEAKWIDSGQLSTEWNSVTGGFGRIVKVMDARRVSYLKEVTKYAVKGSQLAAWSGVDIAMFIKAFTGVRTFGVFGSLYGKRTQWREWIEALQSSALKCDCGCEQFWYRSDDEFKLAEVLAELCTPTRGPTPTAQQTLSL